MGWHYRCDARIEFYRKTGVNHLFFVVLVIKKSQRVAGVERLVLVVPKDREFRLVASRGERVEVDFREIPGDRSFHELVTILRKELIADDLGGHVDIQMDHDLVGVVVDSGTHIECAVFTVGVQGTSEIAVQAVPADVHLLAADGLADVEVVPRTSETVTIDSDHQLAVGVVHLVNALGGVFVGGGSTDDELAAPVQVLGRALHVVGAGPNGGGLDVQGDRVEVTRVIVIAGVVVVGAGGAGADSGAVTVRAIRVESIASPQHKQGEEAQAQDVKLEAGHS